VGIEGNNCRLRHRVRWAFRRMCCFSKKPDNHGKAFEMGFFYLNYGFVWGLSYFLDYLQKRNCSTLGSVRASFINYCGLTHGRPRISINPYKI
jgi:hypothetical protein